MQGILKRLVSSGIFEPLNVVKLHSFRTQMKTRELSARKQFPWAYVPLSKLGFLARAMGYLVRIFSFIIILFDSDYT
jgi:ATP-dependent DNA helicase MPH1